MNKETIRVTMLISMFLLLYPMEIHSQIPEAAAQYAVNKADNLFSCSRFDGYAGCWHNDWEKRDRVCRDGHERWSYSPWFGGRCYCCTH